MSDSDSKVPLQDLNAADAPPMVDDADRDDGVVSRAASDLEAVFDVPVQVSAVLGRSRECDCVFDDQNVSRRHAELRRNNSGDWQIVDLGSTNGVKVNGRRVDTSRLAPGDDVNLGTVSFTFDIQA